MYYCNECANRRGWPITQIQISGACECCGRRDLQNECDDAKLPTPVNIRMHDVGCGHSQKFRHIKPNSTTEYCLICANERLYNLWLEQLGERNAYEQLREEMPIDAKPGTKVVVWFPHHGYNSQSEGLKKLGIKLGDVLTIERTEPSTSSTDVYVKEFPGKRFNSVHFALATPADFGVLLAHKLQDVLDWATDDKQGITELAEKLVPEIEDLLQQACSNLKCDTCGGLTQLDCPDCRNKNK